MSSGRVRLMDIVVGLICLAGFVVLAMNLEAGWLHDWDNKMHQWIDPASGSEGLTSFMKVVTLLGSIKVVGILVLLVAIWFILRRSYREAFGLLVTVAGSLVINRLLKETFERDRPDLPHLVKAGGFSFPSSNAMLAAAFFGMLGYLLWKHFGRSFIYPLVAAIIAAVVAVSRVYLQVHYFSDVVAGVLAGVLWFLICKAIFASGGRRYRSSYRGGYSNKRHFP